MANPAAKEMSASEKGMRMTHEGITLNLANYINNWISEGVNAATLLDAMKHYGFINLIKLKIVNEEIIDNRPVKTPQAKELVMRVNGEDVVLMDVRVKGGIVRIDPYGVCPVKLEDINPVVDISKLDTMETGELRENEMKTKAVDWVSAMKGVAQMMEVLVEKYKLSSVELDYRDYEPQKSN